MERTTRNLRWGALASAVVALVALAAWVRARPALPSRHAASVPFSCAERLSSVFRIDLGPYRRNAPERLLDIQVRDAHAFLSTLLTPFVEKACPAEGTSQALLDADTRVRERCSTAEVELTRASHNRAYELVFGCFDAWMAYRHAAAVAYGDGLSLDREGRRAVLESRLHPALVNANTFDYGAVASAAEELAGEYGAREPEKRFLALTYAAQARYLDWLRSDPAGRAPKEAAVDRAVAALRKTAPNHPVIGELALAVRRTISDPPQLREAALAYLEERPDLTTGDYYVAWADYLMGDGRRAKWHLARILAGHPADARASYSLEALLHPERVPTGDPIFLDAAAEFGGIAFAFDPRLTSIQ